MLPRMSERIWMVREEKVTPKITKIAAMSKEDSMEETGRPKRDSRFKRYFWSLS